MIFLNKEKLQEILRSFYFITHVRIAVLDEWHNEIAAYPSKICSLCAHLRQNEKIDEACRKSDENAFYMAEKSRCQYTYLCHMNLYESVYPIVINEKVAGFLMIGQFTDGEDRENIRESILQKIGKEADIKKEMEELTVLNKQAVSAIASIMSVCAEYLCFSKAISMKSTGLAAKLENYIERNLSEKISVQMLADRFGVSRTSVYLAIKNSFGKGVTEFVNFKKMEEAKRMASVGCRLEEILSALGIMDENYFRRMFKAYCGMSFGKYKKSFS